MTRAWLITAVVAAALAAPGQASAAPARERPCFGAAARVVSHPCSNPRLRRVVTPTPDEALLTPNLWCESYALSEVLEACEYGVGAEEARERVAIVGDSHAGHWRPALDVVAHAKRWRIVEFYRSRCPFSLARPALEAPLPGQCLRRNRELIDHLAAHPEIRTVLVSAVARSPIVPPKGHTQAEGRVLGFRAAWRRLPASVERLIVLRDIPTDAVATHDCVRRAIRRHRDAGTRCALPRHRALPHDAAVTAAATLDRKGTGVVDLTYQFCGRTRCFPVVGGVLVHKDLDHLTPQFATTLGPILLRKLNRLR